MCRLSRCAALSSLLVCLGAGSSFAAAGKPAITAVTFGGSPSAPKFVIHGRNFGSRPAAGQPPSSSSACRQDGAAGNQGLNYGNKLFFVDSAKFSGGLSGPYRGVPDVIDCVGLVVQSYTANRIVYSLGSDYRKHPYSIPQGDRVTFVVAGARATLPVRYGKTAVNPGG